MDTVGALTGIAAKVGLGIVLALGATAAVRSCYLARHGWRPAKGAVRVVETAALGQHRAIHLIAVGRRTLLIASTPSEVVMLADVSADCEGGADGAERPGERTRQKGGGFASLLGGLLARPGGAHLQGDSAAELRAAADALRAEGGRPG